MRGPAGPVLRLAELVLGLAGPVLSLGAKVLSGDGTVPGLACDMQRRAAPFRQERAVLLQRARTFQERFGKRMHGG